MGRNFWDEYNKWKGSILAKVKMKYPGIDPGAIEVCENGEVFIHDGGAYPIILKNFEMFESRFK